jgi:tetratricopeptide (TPR) repeat protein
VAETRIDELRRRLERDPGSRLFAQLAEEYRKAGDHAEAIRVSRAGLALHPAYPSARLTLGRALLDSGDAPAARTELAEVLREAPDNILASRFLGQALEMVGDLAGALKQYAATLKMAPGDRQLEAQVAALRLRAQSGGAVASEVTAPMRPVAPPLPPGARAAPRPPGAAAAAPAPPPARPSAPAGPRPAVPPPPPTLRMVPPSAAGERVPDRATERPSPSEATILIRPAAAPLVPPPPSPAPAPTPATQLQFDVEAPVALGGRPAEESVSMSRPVAPTAPEETWEEAPTVPNLSALASTLPPAEKPAASSLTSASASSAPPAAPAAEGSFEEALDDPPAAPTAVPAAPLAARPAGPADTVDGGPPAPPVAPAPAPAPPPPASDLAADTLSPEVPAATLPASVRAALSSSTLAELYSRQGLTERAREVYLQVLAEDPGNQRARAGLRDLEAAAPLDGPVAERAARRAALQRTIAALEAMLAAVRRD